MEYNASARRQRNNL